MPGNVNKTGQPPNSCGSLCLKPLSCPHRCSQICHAGPCDPCVQGCKPQIRKTEVRIRQTSFRGSRIGDRDGVIDAAVNADLERAAPRPRAPQDSLSLLFNRMVKLHCVSLALTLTLMALVIGWTAVIVKPFNHKSIAENNKGVRGTWALLGIAGFFITIYNSCCVPAFNKTGREIKGQMGSRLPRLTALLGIFNCPWAVFHCCLTLTWVIGPFIRYALLLPNCDRNRALPLPSQVIIRPASSQTISLYIFSISFLQES